MIDLTFNFVKGHHVRNRDSIANTRGLLGAQLTTAQSLISEGTRRRGRSSGGFNCLFAVAIDS